MTDSLYKRLGGYDGVAGFVGELLPRLQQDTLLARFWQNRGDDGIEREKQLLIDYLCHKAGGPVYYTGRNMDLTHKGMGISEQDWAAFLNHAVDTMNTLAINEAEQSDVASFVASLKANIVEC